ncbi:hypothetical protein M3Y97_00603600 [Aphelenchoides bicaudatus]|nr:hypothetical protein M3Y97_00603600 [Aphelenchoides bicaudatus]
MTTPKLLILLLLVAGTVILSNGKAVEKKKEQKCNDKEQNLITAKSDSSKPKPAVIKSFRGTVYNIEGSPSCSGSRPTVLLPGYVKLLDGELHVPKKYDLVKNGVIKLTIRGTNFDTPLCLNGESQYLALPNSFCTTDLCSFIGADICRILEQPGVHSIKELEEKLGFNSTLELPEAPSLLGISLLDLFSGEFSFGFDIEHAGESILVMKVPTNEAYLQIGVTAD